MNKRERKQLNKIREERGDIATDTTEIQRIIRKYYIQLYTNKADYLGQLDKSLETECFKAKFKKNHRKSEQAD